VLIVVKTYEGGIGESSRHESHGNLIHDLSICGA
jgi:hypothetical protein